MVDTILVSWGFHFPRRDASGLGVVLLLAMSQSVDVDVFVDDAVEN